MTAAQLAHLAELANDAARYYRNSRPAWARTFADAAHTADLATIDEGHGEQTARLRLSPR